MTKKSKKSKKTLSPKQEMYWNSIKINSGVVYLKGEPGIAKSAILKNLADKLGLQYIDIRLSMVDETEVGIFPTISLDKTGNKFVEYVVPEWAVMANEKPSLIHFEEINRAGLAVRNASLQILLDRKIGHRFAFNDNVYFCSSGNLGESDGTDVEEFDSALNNRLIHFRHTLTIDEWIDDFAKENVFPGIVNFLKAFPEHYYKRNENGTDATPRSWTFLSDFIKGNGIKDSDYKGALNLCKNNGVGINYVGASITKFLRYPEDNIQININDILMRYDEVKEQVNEMPRARISEFIQQLKEMKIKDMSSNEIANITKFTENLMEDEKVAYLLFIIDNNTEDDLKSKKLNNFLKNFKPLLLKVQG